mgnify:CR=1 FL=1
MRLTHLSVVLFVILFSQGHVVHAQPKVDPDSAEYEEGKQKAELEISDRKLTLLSFGLLEIVTEGYESQSAIYQRIMHDRYGVEIWNLGCLVSSKTVNYIAGYNDEMEKYLKSKYGDDFFEKLDKEVKLIYERQTKQVNEKEQKPMPKLQVGR